LLQLPVVASVTVCWGDEVLPEPNVMLPAVTLIVSKTIVFTVPDDGLVGSGDGAPAGAARLVVAFTVVPDATVVPAWNVMVALHEPSDG
jgi:hypothetical protein